MFWSARSMKPTKFKDEYVSTEHLFLAIAGEDRDPAGQLLKKQGASHEAILQALAGVRGSQRVTSQNPGGHVCRAGKICARPDRAGAAREARSGDRPRRRNPPRDADSGAAHEKQSGADRRARRGQDRHRRGSGAAHRFRRRAGSAEDQKACGAGSGGAGGRRKISAANSKTA